jgi:hypothetical protein
MELLDRDTIKNALYEKICKVTFTKVNGEERVMYCTLNELMIPSDGVLSETTKSKTENPAVQPVYDVNAPGWRSFRWDSVKDFTSEFIA